ncbi:hypothetical protein DC366_17130 [Pelagivirga sediminicola]|uniref:Uncharacterized protein n=1 Tax=Pelagivirga sediminicola TaxID=2170575 RepID=A0A2T7G327_9RHOB|nr:hypothetical protein [Pelagivirga sediminicola]PVA08822.1 hypothetical protein DC366_17130 [Pelagivirga sediminicola]
MSSAAPRLTSKVIALLSSLVVAGIAIVALWTYLGGSGGDDPATRSRVIGPVREAVDAAAANAEACSRRLGDIAQQSGADLAASLDETQSCGQSARRLAAEGYTALDTATGPQDSPLRAEFLDSAGALLSVYEMQGDDFDMVHDLLQNAHASGAPVAPLGSDVTYTLGNSAPDIAAAVAQLAKTQDAYRKGG